MSVECLVPTPPCLFLLFELFLERVELVRIPPGTLCHGPEFRLQGGPRASLPGQCPPDRLGVRP